MLGACEPSPMGIPSSSSSTILIIFLHHQIVDEIFCALRLMCFVVDPDQLARAPLTVQDVTEIDLDRKAIT